MPVLLSSTITIFHQHLSVSSLHIFRLVIQIIDDSIKHAIHKNLVRTYLQFQPYKSTVSSLYIVQHSHKHYTVVYVYMYVCT